jgi:SAM-dependent methyltransferase
MLLARFVAFATRTARGKRLLWRGWYQFLAARYPDRHWTFMNYGYRPPEAPDAPPPLALEAADEADRSCIQLYDLVARSATVAGRELLEVGCGRGGGADYVARKLDPRRVVGVDLSPRAVALCRRRFAHPRLSFEVGDAERLPFPDAAFDVVLNVESSHCYGRFEAFLREVRRVLRPDGHFLYADFRPCDEIDGWRAALLAAGFAIGAERDLRPGVVAALDADEGGKRDLIARLIDRPLAGIFGEFAALEGSQLNAALRRGDFGYRAFVLTPSRPASGEPPA